MVRDDDGSPPAQSGELEPGGQEPGGARGHEAPWRPRPGDHLVEPLFGALVEEHTEFELVEEERSDGTRVSHLARVWRRVRLFWRDGRRSPPT